METIFTHDPIAIQVQGLTNLLYDLNPLTANALCCIHHDSYQRISDALTFGLPLELIDDLILSINAQGGQRRRSQGTLA